MSLGVTGKDEDEGGGGKAHVPVALSIYLGGEEGVS